MPVADAPARPVPAVGPRLPMPRGPVSEAVVAALAGERRTADLPVAAAGAADPFGEDAQLALYACYELHYRSFTGADPELEWDPELLRLRGALERPFLAALRAAVPAGDDVAAVLEELLVEPVRGTGPSWHLLQDGTAGQLREYVVHRSLYHLKEGDPQAWVIPRLDGQAKASLVAVEHDEYGAGRAERLHAELFAAMMRELGLDDAYGAHLDAVPAVTLATVNVMSLFGLHRALRGALVGQFATVEITSSPGADRLARAVERITGSASAAVFYDEHVEADAVHEQVVRRGVLGDLLAREPELAADVVLGVRASSWLEDRLGAHLLSAWTDGRTSLRTPLR